MWLWWSGMGPLGVIIPGAAGVGGYFLLRDLGLGVMGVGVGIILGGLLTRWLAPKINKQEEGAGQPKARSTMTAGPVSVASGARWSRLW